MSAIITEGVVRGVQEKKSSMMTLQQKQFFFPLHFSIYWQSSQVPSSPLNVSSVFVSYLFFLLGALFFIYYFFLVYPPNCIYILGIYFYCTPKMKKKKIPFLSFSVKNEVSSSFTASSCTATS